MMEFASALPVSQQVLLQELNHRIGNEFFSAMSLVSLAAARSHSSEAKAALRDVTELLHHYAEVHQALTLPGDDALVDAAPYLRRLCLAIKWSKLDHMKIDIEFVASPLKLRSQQCWLMGMVLYELITNAARHAFCDRHGHIRVELMRSGELVECKVQDNGSAQENVSRGRGLTIIGELVKALDGQFERRFGRAGSMSILVVPTGRLTASANLSPH
jgi:two-component sensor histidine kinase